MHDAKPGDIYRDKEGQIWRVKSTCQEPTVYLEQLRSDGSMLATRKSGGVSGLMWDGFVKLEPRT